MNNLNRYSRVLPWFMALLLSLLAAGCGGGSEGQTPILGVTSTTVLPAVPPVTPPVVLAPTVTAVAPINNAAGVPINNSIITAAFSEPMAPIAGTASFTVTCSAPCVSPAGTVALNASNGIATFTLAAGTSLAPSTLYTATVTGAKSLASGLALASPYVWQFTTGLASAVTRPGVTLTVPATTTPGPTTGVPTNTAITA
ncbi:MAG: Ig-like domain-containing protein, partial [Burkholderiales bacterium]